MPIYIARYHDNHEETDFAKTIHEFIADYPDARLYAPAPPDYEPPRDIE